LEDQLRKPDSAAPEKIEVVTKPMSDAVANMLNTLQNNARTPPGIVFYNNHRLF
jgi:hypothetical protein